MELDTLKEAALRSSLLSGNNHALDDLFIGFTHSWVKRENYMKKMKEGDVFT